MKTIKESIIGRKGMPLRSEAWIMFPMEDYYTLAEDIFPEEYRVRAGGNYVFCIDDVRWLKRYFDFVGRGNNNYSVSFSRSWSDLCVIKLHSHFKNIDHIKEWLRSVKRTEDIYLSPYVDVIKDVQKYIETL